MRGATVRPTVAGIVLAGGRSRRMGADKASLPWSDGTLVGHVSEVLRRSLDGPVVVVGSTDGELPTLPVGVDTARDAPDAIGPLGGLAAGLAAVRDRADVAFVAAADLPWLHPAVVRRVIDLLDADHDVAVPWVDDHPQALVAAYRTHLADLAAELARAPGRGPRHLLAAVRSRRVTAADLLADPAVADADPDLRSLEDVDDPRAYRAALRAAPPPASGRPGEGARSASTEERDSRP